MTKLKLLDSFLQETFKIYFSKPWHAFVCINLLLQIRVFWASQGLITKTDTKTGKTKFNE